MPAPVILALAKPNHEVALARATQEMATQKHGQAAEDWLLDQAFFALDVLAQGLLDVSVTGHESS